MEEMTPSLCSPTMSFQECQLMILRHAMEINEKKAKQIVKQKLQVEPIMSIVQEFLRQKQLICYGGLAINNILPEHAQFYDQDIEIPDYDFYSSHALEDAIALADVYYQHGYLDVEAKSGMHYGTFKVFVNFIPVADITYLHPDLFHILQQETIVKHDIHYASPNYLRMNMFLELSRPEGDVSRWEKVMKRLQLLNTYYPMKTTTHTSCQPLDIPYPFVDAYSSDIIYHTVRDIFVEEGCIFFGGYTNHISSFQKKGGMRKKQRNHSPSIHSISDNNNMESVETTESNMRSQTSSYQYSDFDVLSIHAKETANTLIQKFISLGIPAFFIEYSAIGEIIPKHYDICLRTSTSTSTSTGGMEKEYVRIATIYEPIACHSYNTIEYHGTQVHIATIDTILSFYLAFHFSKKSKYYQDRILCMANVLFQMEHQQRKKHPQHIMTRFPSTCYGKQKTIYDIRLERARKYHELTTKTPNVKEYNMWFLKYSPAQRHYDKQDKVSIMTYLTRQFERILYHIQHPKQHPFGEMLDTEFHEHKNLLGQKKMDVPPIPHSSFLPSGTKTKRSSLRGMGEVDVWQRNKAPESQRIKNIDPTDVYRHPIATTSQSQRKTKHQKTKRRPTLPIFLSPTFIQPNHYQPPN
jgi:Poly(A) polymerase catalytic subunit